MPVNTHLAIRKLILSTSIFLTALSGLFAQIDSTLQTYDYEDKRTFNIGGIEIIGAENRDRNAIKSIADLREGKQITIPGDDIPRAVKALLRLGLFEDVQVIQTDLKGDLIFLQLKLIDRPTLSRYSIRGVNKNKHDALTDIIDATIKKDAIVTEDLKELVTLKLREHFVEKGFLDTEINIIDKKDELKDNAARLIFDVDRGERVKIGSITVLGNTKFPDAKLKRKLKGTKVRGTVFKKSKYVQDAYEEDKKNLIAFYNSKGYRDAEIVSDSIWRAPYGDLHVQMEIDEGNQY